MNTIKLLHGCRLVLSISNRTLRYRAVKIHFHCGYVKYSPNYALVNVRNMAQTNITLFFKKTTKKSEEDNNTDPVSSKNESKQSLECNGNAKRSAKRSRSTSKENNLPQSNSSSPVGSDKKKKVKRQRIESSESECESPTKSSSDETEIKVEKSTVTKTYDSPKSKKSKANKAATDKKIKEEKSSPKSKTPKKELKNSPMGKFAVKIDKKVDSNTKDEEKIKGEDGEANQTKDDLETNNGAKQGIVDEIDYNPGKSKYHPVKDACWSKDQPVPYFALARTLEVIEATSARLKMIEILSNYYRSVIALTPEDLLPSIYLCLNQLGPAYDSLELGIAETYLLKAIGACTGRSLAQTRAAARGSDLGALAAEARRHQRTMFPRPPLLVRAVLAAFKDIAAMTGHASVSKKIQKIQSLYVACKATEARYLIRSLEGKLRIGLAEQSVLQALAQAAAGSPHDADMHPDRFKALVDEYALIVKSTYCSCPNYDMMVPVLLQRGVRALPEHCRLTPGVPLRPMLAHPTRGVHEVFARFESEVFTCEWKYDGERAQIHVPGEDAPALDRAAVFSRNQENTTSKYPDVVARLPQLLRASVRSCVLDCEAVAYDTGARRILPFQVLSTRKRKDASVEEIKVQVCVYVFDMLYLNGESLVLRPLLERRQLLREHLHEVEGSWQLAVGRDCSSADQVQECLTEAVASSCEGLMVKALTGPASTYDIARRSHNWLKLKKDYLEGVGDSIDAVVLGAYLGRGRRARGYGGFLLACRDPQADHFQALCKIGTGFTDQDLVRLQEDLDRHIIDGPKSYYMFDESHRPDVWFSAECVWEVRCADLSLSPAHRAAAGLVAPGRGVSLRFPRFVRVREDKSAEEATTARQIADMYLAQQQVHDQAPAAADHY